MKLTSRIGGPPGVLSGAFPAPTALSTHQAPAAATCTVRQISQDRLITDEQRHVHIQPLIAVPSANGDVLIAGTYNYLFEESSRGQWSPVPRDSIFGAIRTRSGTTKVVTSPIPTRLLVAPKAVAQRDGTWAVVFGEVEPYTGDSRPMTAVRLWFGVLDASGNWSALEEIPIPSGEQPVHLHVSSLVRSGDSFAWAMQVLEPTSIGIFERKNDEGWLFEKVRTRGGIYPELVNSHAHGLILLVVHPDYSIGNDGNSLFLWTRQPDWAILRRVVRGSEDGYVNEPTIALTPTLGVISWFADAGVDDQGYERKEARATIGNVLDRNQPVIALDSSVTNDASVRFIGIANGGPIWIVNHEEADRSGREIRFVQYSGGTVERLAAFPNPYITRLAAASFDSEVLLFGGIKDTEQGVVVTGVLQLRVECPTNSA